MVYFFSSRGSIFKRFTRFNLVLNQRKNKISLTKNAKTFQIEQTTRAQVDYWDIFDERYLNEERIKGNLSNTDLNLSFESHNKAENVLNASATPILSNDEAKPLTHQSSSDHSATNITINESCAQNDDGNPKKCFDWFWQQYDHIFFNFTPKIYDRANAILENRMKQRGNQEDITLIQLEAKLIGCLENMHTEFDNQLREIQTNLKRIALMLENSTDAAIDFQEI